MDNEIAYNGHILEQKDFCWANIPTFTGHKLDMWTNYVCKKCGAKFKRRNKKDDSLEFCCDYKEQCQK